MIDDETALLSERTPLFRAIEVEQITNPSKLRKKTSSIVACSILAVILLLLPITTNKNRAADIDNVAKILDRAEVSLDHLRNEEGTDAVMEGVHGKTNEIDSLFQNFVEKFKKTYDTDQEYIRRREIFRKNVERIEAHNSDVDEDGNAKHSWKMGMNQFTDMLPDEIPMGFDKGSLHGERARKAFSETSSRPISFGSSSMLSNGDSSLLRFRKLSVLDLPESVDWSAVTPAVTTPVKDQGSCGSCWAFAATAVLESHVAISSGKLLSLSPQELVSCAPNPNHCGGTGGCAGSTGELAYDYVSKHGMVSEWADGYTSYNGKTGHCGLYEGRDGLLMGAVASVEGFSSLPTNSYDSLMYAVATLGPVVVSVAANAWRFYKGGVLDDSKFGSHYDINHAVVLEGYGTDVKTGEMYWLVRNSWGVLWGESGYIRLKRSDPSTADDFPSLASGHCKMDITPLHGEACAGADDNATVPDQLVCGTSGILYSSVVPVGAHLIGH